jgi:hypothetical protein
VHDSLVMQMDQSSRNLDQLTASIGQRPSTNCEDTHEPLAVRARIVRSRVKEGAQWAFHADEDKSQPFAPIALLAKDAEESHDIGMVEPAAPQPLYVSLLPSWISQEPAKRAMTYLVHESISIPLSLHTEPLHDHGDPRCGPCSVVYVGEAAEPGRNGRVVLDVCKVVAIEILVTLRCGLRKQLVRALRGRPDHLVRRFQPLKPDMNHMSVATV